MIFTKKRLKVYEYIALFFAVFLIGLILTNPGACARGAKSGLKICADVLIPAIFPFAVPVLFIINTNIFNTQKHKVFFVFLLSLLGGYPIGAKMLSELYKNGGIDIKTAKKVLPFCINAGPAFIVIAVGEGILNSVKIGYVLLGAHCFAGIILVLIFMRKEFLLWDKPRKICNKISVSDNLVKSINGASNAVITLCSYVIVFSVINEYITAFLAGFNPLNNLILITEITSAVNKTKNIYLIAFLLGFAGFSIWAQVFAVSGDIRPGILRLIFVRAAHGALAALFTKLYMLIFGVGVATISNGVVGAAGVVNNDISLTVSLLIMALLLIISITSKKFCGNIIKDML